MPLKDIHHRDMPATQLWDFFFFFKLMLLKSTQKDIYIWRIFSESICDGSVLILAEFCPVLLESNGEQLLRGSWGLDQSVAFQAN